MEMASPTEKSARPVSMKDFWAVVALSLVVFGVYFNSLQNGFVHDDGPQIIMNPYIRSLDNLPKIFSSAVWEILEFYDSFSRAYYRPIMMAVLALEYRAFGLDPRPYHFISVALHAVFTLSFFAFARLLLSKLKKAGKIGMDDRLIWRVSFLAALLSAVHPINAQAVNWISSFTEIVFSTLIIWYLAMALSESRKVRWLSLIPAFLALLTKETAVAYLPMLYTAKWILDGNGDSSFWKKSVRIAGDNIMHILPLAAYLALRVLLIRGSGLEINASELLLMIVGWLVYTPGLVVRSVWHIVNPTSLNFFYRFGYWPDYLSTVVFGLILFFFGGLSYAKKRIPGDKPLLWLCWWLFLWTALPSFDPLLSHLFLSDRYLYLPSAWFFLAVAYMFFGILGLGRAKGRIWEIAALSTAAICFVTLSFLTVRQNGFWRDDRTLFGRAVSGNRYSAAAQTWDTLNICYEKDSDCEAAAARATDFILGDPLFPEVNKRITPDNFLFVHALANGDLDRMRQLVEAVRAKDPGRKLLSRMYLDLSVVEYRRGDLELAESDLVEALRLFPESRTLNLAYGLLECDRGRLDSARVYFDKSVEYGNPPEKVEVVRRLCPGRSIWKYQEKLDYLLAAPFRNFQ